MNSKIHVFLVLSGLSLLIILARCHTYYEPLERDITTYAVIAHEMLQGRKLYSDLVDIKPPGIFITYAAMELIAGYGVKSIFLINILAAIITLFGAYLAGVAMTEGRRTGGLWAAAIWAIISGNLVFQANQPNVEVVLNACLIWAFAVFARGYQVKRSHRNLVIGILIGIATVHKQITVVMLPLFYGIQFLFPPPSIKRRHIIIDFLISSIIVGAIWLLILGYFSFTGRFRDFYDVIIVYSRSYAGNIYENLIQGVSLDKLRLLSSPVVFPLLLFTILGIIIGLCRKKHQWGLMLAYITGAQIMVSLPGKFFPHYYQLWLPVLSVGAAAAFLEIEDILKNRLRWLSLSLPGIVALVLLMHQLPLYRLSPEEWSRRKYGEDFILTRALGREIPRILEPGETFYEWGIESGLYFYSKKSPPTGIILFYPLLNGPLVEKYSEQVINDLKRNKPDLLILPPKLPINHPVIRWISSGCWRLVQKNVLGFFKLYARCGGGLDSRIRKARIPSD